jgi:peroxiredoxin
MGRILFIALWLGAGTLLADVVRPAPDFKWAAFGGQVRSLKSLRGQPVVLLVAQSSRTGAFRSQINHLEDIYRLLSARNVVFAAAFTSDDRPVHSDIPFVLATSGPEVAQAFEVHDKFNIIIIGRDGNIDLQTGEVLSGERVRDVIINSFEAQQATRKR